MKKLQTLLFLTISLLVIAGCGAKEKDSEQKAESNKTEKVEVPKSEKSDVYFKDDVLKIDMATMKILTTEVLPADTAMYRDKPQLVFTYEVTNDSDEPLNASSVWIACMEVTQEGENTINKLNVGMTPQDEKFKEYTEHQMDDIKPTGTVKAVISYDLDDTETAVIVKASQGMGGKELGEKIIDLK